MTQRKIILLVNSLSETGGVSTRCRSMHRYLSAHYICDIVELKNFLGDNKIQKINPISLLRMVIAVKDRLKSVPPCTVVISFSDLPNLVNSLLSSNSIVSITGFPLKRNGFGFLRYILWKYFLNMLTLFCCKRVVPCSPVVIPKYIMKIPIIESKVYIINGFLDISQLVPDFNLSASLKSDFPEGYLLYIGRLDKNKCVDRIIETYKLYCELTHKHKKLLPLLIVGDGPYRKICKTIVANHYSNLANADRKQSWPPIVFRPETEHAYTYIANASVVLLGSKSEGFSNVALESLYAKTPILLSKNRGNIFLHDFIDCQGYSFLIKLLPALSTKESLSIWASYMRHYAHNNTKISHFLSTQVVRKCSAEANIFKWIKVIESAYKI